MKKSVFCNLVIGVVGGLLFSVGMCCCLLPQWNAFDLGVALAGVGAVILLAQVIVNFVKSGKKIKINWKVVGKVAYGTLASLVLGVGMCLILVWNRMLQGIIVGVVGIVMLLCLIPMCLGLK